MHETGKLHGIPVLSLPVMLAAATLMISVSAFAGLIHESKVETTVNLSQGYRHGDTIFFLADVHRYQRGRTFWFILPLKAGPKTLWHRTLLYSLDTGTRALKMEAALADPAELTCMVRYAKWTQKDGILYFSYNPSNRLDAKGHTERVLFARDMASGRVEKAGEGGGLEAELFGNYRSPYRDNPGIVEISDYKKLLPPDPWKAPRELP